MKVKITEVLCKLGFHKWSKPKFYTSAASNVIDYIKYCIRCKRLARWCEPKPTQNES